MDLASEFPNDNPALHRGVRWVCLEVTGAPVAVFDPVGEPIEPALIPDPVTSDPVPVTSDPVPVTSDPVPEPVPEPRISCVVPVGALDHTDVAPGIELDDDEAALIVVEELPPLDETACLEGAVEATTLPPAPEDPFTVLLCTLTDVAIAAGSPHVASLLPALLLEGQLERAVGDEAAQALAQANITRDAQVTPAFAAQIRAWHAILLGTSDDFAACGGAMLDEWAANLLSRLLGAPARAEALRRELRSRGVAAFGLVEAA